jgi:hypothetical protein
LHYKIVWVDSDIESIENKVHAKLFYDLGFSFTGLAYVDQESSNNKETNTLEKFLLDDEIKDNVLIISSGSLAEKVIELI